MKQAKREATAGRKHRTFDLTAHQTTTLSDSESPPVPCTHFKNKQHCTVKTILKGIVNTTYDMTTMKSHSEYARYFSSNFTRRRKVETYSSSYLQAMFALSVLVFISTKCNALSFIDSKHHLRLQSTRTTSHPKFPQTMRQRQNYDRCCSSTMLRMGKGDGKNKKKKKRPASSSPASSTPDAPGPAPLRVTSDSNVPVRRQILWAKMNKEYRTSGTAFRQTNVRRKTSYRKSLGELFILQFVHFKYCGIFRN